MTRGKQSRREILGDLGERTSRPLPRSRGPQRASSALGVVAYLLVLLSACTPQRGPLAGDCDGCLPGRDGRAVQGIEEVTLRHDMVEEQIVSRGVVDPNVLEAMRSVPRHLYVPVEYRQHAYADTPLPIGDDQTISQPFIVALMTELLAIDREAVVLEVGTGSGYQAAILGEIAREVHTIEIVESLGRRAEATLAEQGYDNVHVHLGDGYAGWPDAAPFDGILVAAAPDHIPQPLLAQLANGGKLVIPVGRYVQELTVVTRQDDEFITRTVIPVRFVPMTGRARGD